MNTRGRSRISRSASRFHEDKSNRFGVIYKVTIALMMLVALTLGYKINETKQFIELPASLDLTIKNLTAWFPFESWFKLDDTPVVAASYQKLTENYYVNGSTTCQSILPGVVLSVNEDAKNVLIQHDNGVLATYGNLETISVLSGERIVQGAGIGQFNETVTLDFLYQGQSIDYQQAMSIE